MADPEKSAIQGVQQLPDLFEITPPVDLSPVPEINPPPSREYHVLNIYRQQKDWMTETDTNELASGLLSKFQELLTDRERIPTQQRFPIWSPPVWQRKKCLINFIEEMQGIFGAEKGPKIRLRQELEYTYHWLVEEVYAWFNGIADDEIQENQGKIQKYLATTKPWYKTVFSNSTRKSQKELSSPQHEKVQELWGALWNDNGKIIRLVTERGIELFHTLWGAEDLKDTCDRKKVIPAHTVIGTSMGNYQYHEGSTNIEYTVEWMVSKNELSKPIIFFQPTFDKETSRTYHMEDRQVRLAIMPFFGFPKDTTIQALPYLPKSKIHDITCDTEVINRMGPYLHGDKDFSLGKFNYYVPIVTAKKGVHKEDIQVTRKDFVFVSLFGNQKQIYMLAISESCDNAKLYTALCLLHNSFLKEMNRIFIPSPVKEECKTYQINTKWFKK